MLISRYQVKLSLYLTADMNYNLFVNFLLTVPAKREINHEQYPLICSGISEQEEITARNPQ